MPLGAQAVASSCRMIDQKKHSQGSLARVAVLIPALNESENLAILLPRLRALDVEQVILCDNGSTDDTQRVVERAGATWAFEPKRGYGAACAAGLVRLDDSIDIVAFLDADSIDDANFLDDLCLPIARGDADFVLGARLPELREPGSTTFPQRVANRLFPVLIRLGWDFGFRDLGPLRAIRRTSLDQMGMRDRAYGWTIEMQIRAVEMNLRILEIPVRHRTRRKGRSKVSGNWRGTIRAAYGITRTWFHLWWTRRERAIRRS